MRQHVGSMAFRGNCVPNGLDFSRGADQKGAADNALEGPAHEFLGSPGAEGLDRFVFRIAQQGKIQFALGLETRQSFHRIGTHPQDHGVGLLEFSQGVTKLGRFDDSTGSIGPGKKEQDHALASKILEGDKIAGIRREGKFWSLITDFQHVRSPDPEWRTQESSFRTISLTACGLA